MLMFTSAPAQTDSLVNARQRVMQWKAVAPGVRNPPEVFLNEYLSDVFRIISAVSGPLLRLAEEGEEMGATNARVGPTKEIKTDQCNATAIDQDVVRLEAAMDKGRRTALQTVDPRLNHAGHRNGKIRARGR